MAALDVAALSGALKQALPSKRIMYVGYRNNPLLGLLPKDPKFGGDVYRCPIWFGGNQGVSATFADAQAGKTGGLYESFDLTRVRKYGLTSIGLEALLASESDAHAFLKARVAEVDNTIRTVSNDIGHDLYGNLGGSRGRIASGSATEVLTLTNLEDIVNFAVGMEIESDDTDGTAGGSSDGEAIAITAVDLDAGTITKAAGSNWNASGNFAANDYLFRDGDFGLCLSGLASWLPSAAPGATAFFGVNRAVDPVRLGGVRYDGSAESIEEALMGAAGRLGREGAEPDVVMMNHLDFTKFKKSLGSNVVYDVMKSTTVPVSFTAIKLVGFGKGGEIRILPDRNCPQGIAYMLQLDTWVFATIGDAPRMLEVPTKQGSFIWDYNADSVEVRTGFYGQLGCFAPGYNARIALPA